MSQRTLSALIVGVFALGAALYAAANHLLPDITDLGAFLSTNFLTIVTPILFVFTTLNQWYDVLDSMVAEGSLKAGEILPLFKLSAFYVAMVSCLSGVLQIFGLKLIDEQTQAVLVNMLLLGATVLLRSFTDRTAQSNVTVAAKVEAAKAQNVK